MSNTENNENKKVKGNGFFKDVLKSIKAVSYTHLTLPTIA